MRATQIEIARVAGPALAQGPCGVSALVTAAVLGGARPAVIARLGELPDRTYPDLRSLWSVLADLPAAHA
ncbi:hypothetical protein [Cellulomonas bogoriensis]|uniref:Uncharacterized protein n=1 Tax=Cellulomonas bogoriensis 69B4 = DSM 16987 TaxID=1386082 RepID=A0A0A0C1K2_9CELL|nr:hypothetical protein [Cellulomonas bogoriensis]KGM14070.1 hypothetical protein N869_05580 [Cellulomonas bogoriensis 69B4 = DSM 16987]